MYKHRGRSIMEGAQGLDRTEVVSNTQQFNPIRPWTLKRIHSPAIKGQGRADLRCGNDAYFYPRSPPLALLSRASRPQFQTKVKLGPGAPASTSDLLLSPFHARSLARPLARRTGSGSRRTHISSWNVRRRGSDPCPRSTPMTSWRHDSDDTAPQTALRSGARASARLVLNPAPAASTITRTLTI